MSYQEFMSGLDPKVAKYVKTAQETNVTKLPLASYGITKALGGGIAKGRVTLIYGSPSAGKSLIVMQSIGQWQKQGLVCAYVDAEGAFDKAFAARLGANPEELILIQSKSSGRIERDIRPLLENNIDVLVIDSISDILPEVFIGKDGAMNEQEDRKQIGSQAKAITALLNGMHFLNKDTAIILISQTTTFMGQSHVEQIPHGGQKVQFASSQIIRLTSSASPNSQITGDVEVGDKILNEPIGRPVNWLIKKNKLGKPFGAGSYDMYYDGDTIGVDMAQEVITRAVSLGVIDKGGSWFTYGEFKVQGDKKMAKHLRENSHELDAVMNEIHLRETGEMIE